jgi:hypothetical protein
MRCRACLTAIVLVLGCGGGAIDEPADEAADAGSGGATTGSGGVKGTGGGSAGTGGAKGTGGASAGTGGAKGTGGATSSGGATGSGGAVGTGGSTGTGGGSGGGGVRQKCTGTVTTTLPGGAPSLTPGVWKDITPPGIPKGDAQYLIGQGFAIDPCNMATLYWGTTPFDAAWGGLYRSTNGGGTWVKLGDKAADSDPWDAKTTYLDEPLHVRVDPRNPQHLYAGDGVRGSTTGFWVSTDGGNNWSKSADWVATASRIGYIDDIYDVGVDPSDFDHVLVSSHSAWAWDSAKYGRSAGVLESTDGGATWIEHSPELSWGYGHAIHFLYDPAKGIGNKDTWLLGTQGDGMWRTTDAGQTWTKTSTSDIFHGGGTVYYSTTGVVYASAYPQSLRSTDNGATWTEVGVGGGTTCVYGDGKLLYTAPAYSRGAQPFVVSPETDGITWTPYKGGAQPFQDSGPYEMAFDPTNGILYASMWFQGVWALKVE